MIQLLYISYNTYISNFVDKNYNSHFPFFGDPWRGGVPGQNPISQSGEKKTPVRHPSPRGWGRWPLGNGMVGVMSRVAWVGVRVRGVVMTPPPGPRADSLREMVGPRGAPLVPTEGAF